MRVDFEFYATLRECVGERHIVRDMPEGATVGEALSSVADEFPNLHGLLFDAEGRLRPHINVLRNDEPLHTLDGADTSLSTGDTVGATPGVAGGAGRTTRAGHGGVCA
ncbi:ubiquitin-like small modifier protein 1 [Halomarina litorea]|uniref:ubiquitin-like small modifier protein 1 n=1 Tax=Halomarina litorea TaxID=2961595 RepID=UPI0020C4CB58|nr:ubiquitin-like small modifier protein 1 [Halomarina sp. BCD28]